MNTETTAPSNTDVPEITSVAFAAYDATNVPAVLAGMRLSKCQYKKDKETGVLPHVNSVVIIPEVLEADINSDQWTTLMPHVLAMLEATQDKLIKECHMSGVASVPFDTISITGILDKLESEGEGRLNKEKIFSWFDADVRELLVVAFGDKLGITDEPTEAEQAQLDKTVGIYRDRFGALAGANSSFIPSECDKLINALVVTENDKSVLGSRFITRLDAMKNKEDNLMDLL